MFPQSSNRMWQRRIRTKVNVVSKLKEKRDTFHKSVKPAMLIAQLFGLFPLTGLLSDDLNNIKFKWISLRTLHSFVVLFFSIFGILTVLYDQLQVSPFTPASLIGVIFYTNSFVIAIMFFRIARKWKDIMRYWHEIEDVFLEDKYLLPPTKWNLKKRLFVIYCFFFVALIVEHSLSQLSSIAIVAFKMEKCHIEGNLYEIFLEGYLNQFFRYLGFNLWKGISVLYVNFAITFNWNFGDIFLMLISTGITYRFDQINDRMEYFRGRVIPESVWFDLRKNYTELSELTFFIDRQFGPLTVMICLNGSYFILMQLLNITNALPFVVNYIYFAYSLLYLILKTSVLFLLCSTIHERSKKPLEVFRSVPSVGWYQELQRFYSQVRDENIALSGMKFYHLTRNLLFTLAGTLLTYELVLLQTDRVEVDLDSAIPCD